MMPRHAQYGGIQTRDTIGGKAGPLHFRGTWFNLAEGEPARGEGETPRPGPENGGDGCLRPNCAFG